MDFYEVGVYLVIIVVASTCVFGVMWLLMRSMQPKGKKAMKNPALASPGNAPRQVAEKPPRKTRYKKQSKNRKDKLITLKELPDSKLLPAGEADQSAPGKAKAGFLLEQKDEEPVVSKDEVKPTVKKIDAREAKTESKQGDNAEPGGEIAMPDLPSLDTITEGEEETAQEQDALDLMSVFETEETEDSATTDLAANLFDVDVQNIEKLGSEISEFLGGMRSK